MSTLFSQIEVLTKYQVLQPLLVIKFNKSFCSTS